MAELYQNLNTTSKYTYRINECESEIIVIELIIKRTNDKISKIRKIINSRSGKLLTSEDNIDYTDIKKIMISLIDINNPNKEINIIYNFNNANKQNIIFDNNIFIELFNKDNLLESNYNIMNI
jgi:hypothetical protein